MKFAPALSLLGVAIILYGCISPRSTTGQGALPEAGFSPVRPSAQTSGGDLLYVAGGRNDFLFTYPKAKLLGTFGPAAFGLCSDKNGTVYLTTFNTVEVYAHGATTPVRTLKVPGDYAIDCSIDPTSGDLAVAVNCLSCNTSLAIFHHARGIPTAYAAGMIGQHCGYDNRGNVLLAGITNGTEFVELAKGSKTFTPITFNPAIPVGHIQWDGHYLTVENFGAQTTPQIYRVTISGSTGSVVGTTYLDGAYNAANEWIDGGRVIVPFVAAYYGAGRVGYWKYPAGGTPEKVLLDRRYRFHGPSAVTVSVAPNRR